MTGPAAFRDVSGGRVTVGHAGRGGVREPAVAWLSAERGEPRAGPRRADGTEEALQGVHLLIVQVPQGTGRSVQDPPDWGTARRGRWLIVITITSM